MTRRVICTALTALALTGCGSDDEGSTPMAADEQPQTQSQSTPAPAGQCGAAFEPPAAGPLRATASFASSAKAADGMLTGEIEVEASGAVKGTTSQSAAGLLVREGKIVSESLIQDAMGVPVDLAPGDKTTVPAAVPLSSCQTPGEPLPAGEYELHVTYVVIGEDGSRVEAHAGPTAITLS